VGGVWDHIEAGIYQVWERMSSGRLKVFDNLAEWLKEFRVYRRDDKGHIVKKDDHGLDATRYLISSGLKRAASIPSAKPRAGDWRARHGRGPVAFRAATIRLRASSR
jgi:hypothetical protein